MSQQTATPSSHWRAEGKADPHAGHYDCERAALAMGNLTDDQLANAAFMFYNDYPSLQDVIDGKAFPPITYMTAVKDRIRWLSRSLEKVTAELAALAAELKALREREPEVWYDGNTFYANEESASMCCADMDKLRPLYARPVPARKLTDEMVISFLPDAKRLPAGWRDFARAIERYLSGEDE